MEPARKSPPTAGTRGAGVPSVGAFDFTLHLRVLCQGLVTQLPELSHVDLDRVAIGFRQTRKRVLHGMQASLTPLRFLDGSQTTFRRGRWWSIPKLLGDQGQELLYLLNVYLPRFFDHPPVERLSTIVHELWHISPDFNGDLRRHAGRCYAHGRSQQEFDAIAAQLAARFAGLSPELLQTPLLSWSFRQVLAQHGSVRGLKYATPRLFPVPPPASTDRCSLPASS